MNLFRAVQGWQTSVVPIVYRGKGRGLRTSREQSIFTPGFAFCLYVCVDVCMCMFVCVCACMCVCVSAPTSDLL